MRINDRPTETPKISNDRKVKVDSVESVKSDPEISVPEKVERRRKRGEDRRKRNLRWHGKFDMRSGKDRRRKGKDTPSVDIDA